MFLTVTPVSLPMLFASIWTFTSHTVTFLIPTALTTLAAIITIRVRRTRYKEF